ncbi:hypothetical protein [Pseudomonas sp. PLMAX]|uniref:hypothetical protein n=1 Tax=Pseudomonas sp. PLMAX TaxID=2201998 RepID=UPI0038BBE308
MGELIYSTKKGNPMLLGAIFSVAHLAPIATDMFVDYLAKRLVSTVIDETTSRAKNAAGSIGDELLGKLKFWDDIAPNPTPAGKEKSTVERVQQLVNETMAEVGVTMIKTDELEALMKVAAAADGQGDLKQAFAAWKKMAEQQRKP